MAVPVVQSGDVTARPVAAQLPVARRNGRALGVVRRSVGLGGRRVEGVVERGPGVRELNRVVTPVEVAHLALRLAERGRRGNDLDFSTDRRLWLVREMALQQQRELVERRLQC